MATARRNRSQSASPVSDWSTARIYPRVPRSIGPSCEYSRAPRVRLVQGGAPEGTPCRGCGTRSSALRLSAPASTPMVTFGSHLVTQPPQYTHPSPDHCHSLIGHGTRGYILMTDQSEEGHAGIFS
eukprot:1175575-Prorocentrum_minimum.AAC.2